MLGFGSVSSSPVAALSDASNTLSRAATLSLRSFFNETFAYKITYLRPSADGTITSWKTDSGATSNLYQSIDEPASPNDADYLTTTVSTGQSNAYTTLLSAISDPNTRSGHVVRYRVRAQTPVSTNMTVTLKQTSTGTTIASWTHTGLTASWTTYQQTLTTAQADQITNYGSLSLVFEASA